MKAGNLVAGDAAHQRLLDNLGSALCAGALPGELRDFGAEDCRAAALFVAGCASRRQPGAALVRHRIDRHQARPAADADLRRQ